MFLWNKFLYLKVELAGRKNENVPKSWGVDKNGVESVRPDEIMAGGGLLPLGGTEITSSFLMPVEKSSCVCIQADIRDSV